MIKYTVYKCIDNRNKYNVIYNVYQHEKIRDYYIASFRKKEHLKKFLSVLDCTEDEIFISNVLVKDEQVWFVRIITNNFYFFTKKPKHLYTMKYNIIL